MSTEKILKVILWIVGVYHISLGLLGIFAKETAVFLANNFFNFNLTLNEEMLWVLNPFATYLLVFGIFMIIAANNPKKYKNIIYAGVGLCALRVIQRLVFIFSAPTALVSNNDPMRNGIMIAVVLALGCLMYLLTKKLK